MHFYSLICIFIHYFNIFYIHWLFPNFFQSFVFLFYFLYIYSLIKPIFDKLKTYKSNKNFYYFTPLISKILVISLKDGFSTMHFFIIKMSLQIMIVMLTKKSVVKKGIANTSKLQMILKKLAFILHNKTKSGIK